MICGSIAWSTGFNTLEDPLLGFTGFGRNRRDTRVSKSDRGNQFLLTTGSFTIPSSTVHKAGAHLGTALKLDRIGSPEVALLLASSRGDPGREVIKRLMSRPLDWSLLTRMAIDAHATPGLWQVVSSFPNLPDEAVQLQSIAVLNDFRRYHIRSLAARLSEQLRREGIEVLALKGAALLVGGVDRPTPRTMSDIDLLVLNGSPERAWATCRSNGWTMVDEKWTAEMYQRHHHLAPLLDPDGISVGLELHRTLLAGVERLGLDTGGFVKRSRSVMVNGVPVLVPSIEDLLLHTCLHFAWSNKLHRGAWRAYADAHSVISDEGFSWDRFIALLTTRRIRQSCYWALRLGRVVADLSVPDSVLKVLDPTSGGWMGGLLERHFVLQLCDPQADDAVAQRARRFLWFAAIRERSTSREADHVWTDGSLQVPGEGSASTRPRRGAFRAAVETMGYFAQLLKT
jgi:hypothetical protein